MRNNVFMTNKRFGNSSFTVYIASVQCLLHFGRAFSAGSLYLRYVRLYNCVTQEREVMISVGAHWNLFLFFTAQVLIQVQKAGEGFQGRCPYKKFLAKSEASLVKPRQPMRPWMPRNLFSWQKRHQRQI